MANAQQNKAIESSVRVSPVADSVSVEAATVTPVTVETFKASQRESGSARGWLTVMLDTFACASVDALLARDDIPQAVKVRASVEVGKVNAHNATIAHTPAPMLRAAMSREQIRSRVNAALSADKTLAAGLAKLAAERATLAADAVTRACEVTATPIAILDAMAVSGHGPVNVEGGKVSVCERAQPVTLSYIIVKGGKAAKLAAKLAATASA
jgi:hypothetical protein